MLELLDDPAVLKQYSQLPAGQRAAFDWRARWLMRAQVPSQHSR